MQKHSQSLAGYIRQHLTEIETRLSFGVRQEVIVSELEAIGYKTTVKGFRNFLYRARHQQKITPVQPRQGKESKTETPAPPPPIEKSDVVNETTHRPTDLDAIASAPVDLKSLSKAAKRK